MKIMDGSGLGRGAFGSKVVRGFALSLIVVSVTSLYSYVRVERVQSNIENVNQFYIPVLKHLNVIGGKWSAYQRSFEQSVAFRKWGEKNRGVAQAKLNLRKIVDSNLSELAATLEKTSSGKTIPEFQQILAWRERLSAQAEEEPAIMAEIASLVKLKHYSEAAQVYSRTRQSHLKISQELMALTRTLETHLGTLQLSTEAQLRNAQNGNLFFLLASLTVAGLALLVLRRWMLPIVEWTRTAQEIALKGVNKEISFPKVTSSMPAEIALLTREFTRMGMTVLERERTIHQQKAKLESLNEHLQGQNEMLRKLGSLNERVLNAMTSGLLVINSDGVVEQFNQRYCEMFSVNAIDVFEKNIRDVLAHWPQELAETWFADQDSEVEQRVRLGSRVYQVRSSAMKDRAEMLLSFEDITQIVDAEEKLEHANKLTMAGSMSAQVAHEVRNPLNSMGLHLEMLEEDLAGVLTSEKSESVRSRLNAIGDQVQRLERITRRYLDVGSQTVSCERAKNVFDLNDTIERSLSFLGQEIQAAHVAVELELTPEPCFIQGDEDAISQVVFNLVRNALEAMSATEVPRTLRITSHKKTVGNAAQVAIRVVDTGSGVDSLVREKLFEPFVTSKAQGTGLGLSVSRQVCIDHGGELQFVDSNQGQGAIFELSLPLKHTLNEGAELV